MIDEAASTGIENCGFLDGISLEKDEKNNLSVYAKDKCKITVKLCENSEVISRKSRKHSQNCGKYSVTVVRLHTK